MSKQIPDTKTDLDDIETENLLIIVMFFVIIFLTLVIIFALYRYLNNVNILSSSVNFQTNDMKTLNKINKRQPTPAVPSFQSVDISRVSSMTTTSLNERKAQTKSRFSTLMCLFAKGPGKGKSKTPVPVQFSKFSLGSSTGFNINSTRLTVEPESIRNNPTELKITKVQFNGQPKAKVKYMKEKFQAQNIKPQKMKSKPKGTIKSGTNLQKMKNVGSAKVNSPKLVSKSHNQPGKLAKPKLEAKKSKAK